MGFDLRRTVVYAAGGVHNKCISSDEILFAVRFCGADGTGTIQNTCQVEMTINVPITNKTTIIKNNICKFVCLMIILHA